MLHQDGWEQTAQRWRRTDDRKRVALLMPFFNQQLCISDGFLQKTKTSQLSFHICVISLQNVDHLVPSLLLSARVRMRLFVSSISDSSESLQAQKMGHNSDGLPLGMMQKCSAWHGVLLNCDLLAICNCSVTEFVPVSCFETEEKWSFNGVSCG